MTYNRIGTPRAYVDRLSFDLANGWRTAANYTVLNDEGGAVTFDGGQKEDLFDMRPSNYATIANTTQRFFITLDTGMGSDTTAETNFLAILGHNFHEADAVLKVLVSDSQLSLAIGKEGQNARLAAKLTGYKIDIEGKGDSVSSQEEE